MSRVRLAELPAATRRRLAAWDDDAVTLPESLELVVLTLLEEGSGEELRWLFAELGEAAVAGCFAAHGARRLSRRSRSFWRLVLDTDCGAGHPLAPAIWPLA